MTVTISRGNMRTTIMAGKLREAYSRSPLGTAILELRNQSELTQDRLAEQCAISGSMVAKVEQGVILKPSDDILICFAEKLGGNIEEFRQLREYQLTEWVPENPRPKPATWAQLHPQENRARAKAWKVAHMERNRAYKTKYENDRYWSDPAYRQRKLDKSHEKYRKKHPVEETPQDGTVTMRQAAEQLNVHEETIRRRLKSGNLTAYARPYGKRSFEWRVHLPGNPVPSELTHELSPGVPMTISYVVRQPSEE